MKSIFTFLFAVLGAATVATAGVDQWQALATSGGAGFITTNITEPTQMDIGSYDTGTNGGVTYEIIYNADVGGASSAFLGSQGGAPAGADAGLKLDQWNNTSKFGVTTFGVADFTGVTDSIFNEDAYVAYVADGTDMTLYVNGQEAEVITGASFALSGLTGIGHAYNHGSGASVDPLNGEIIGVAVYDSALAGDAIAANYNAFAVPEPGALGLLLFGLLGGMHCLRRSHLA